MCTIEVGGSNLVDLVSQRQRSLLMAQGSLKAMTSMHSFLLYRCLASGSERQQSDIINSRIQRRKNARNATTASVSKRTARIAMGKTRRERLLLPTPLLHMCRSPVVFVNRARHASVYSKICKSCQLGTVDNVYRFNVMSNPSLAYHPRALHFLMSEFMNIVRLELAYKWTSASLSIYK